MREDDLDKLPVVGLIFESAIQQRLGIAAYCGERSPQFVRNVGHEILARLLLPLDIGHIVKRDHGSAALVVLRAKAQRTSNERPAALGKRQQIFFRCAPFHHPFQNVAERGSRTTS